MILRKRLIFSGIVMVPIFLLSLIIIINNESRGGKVLSAYDMERTAIAIFTKIPELAISSTPYYAEIIANELIRIGEERDLGPIPTRIPSQSISTPVSISQDAINITTTAIVLQLSQTPTIDSSYLTPSFQPLRCVPAVSNVILEDKKQDVEERLLTIGLTTTVQFLSIGVESIDGDCSSPFLATYTKLEVFTEIAPNASSDDLSENILAIFSALNEIDTTSLDIAPDFELEIMLKSGDNYISIIDEFYKIDEALALSLEGDELLNYFR